MKDKDLYKIAFIALSLFVLIIISSFFLSQRSINLQNKFKIQNMKIQSSAFENNQSIPKKYTCDGESINPPLEIKDVPEDAKSLVLIVDDPDAPGKTYSHWIVWNISPETSFIEEGQSFQGPTEGMNDSGTNSYTGPCPPSGVHHYHFKLFALDKTLEDNPSLGKEDVESLMEGNVIDSTELIGTYERE